MEYGYNETQTVNCTRDVLPILAKSSSTARQIASRMRMFHGTVMNVYVKTPSGQWNKIFYRESGGIWRRPEPREDWDIGEN